MSRRPSAVVPEKAVVLALIADRVDHADLAEIRPTGGRSRRRCRVLSVIKDGER